MENKLKLGKVGDVQDGFCSRCVEYGKMTLKLYDENKKDEDLLSWYCKSCNKELIYYGFKIVINQYNIGVVKKPLNLVLKMIK